MNEKKHQNRIINFIKNNKELSITLGTITTLFIAGLLSTITNKKPQSNDECFSKDSFKHEYIFPKHSENGWYLPSDDE